MRLNLRKLLLNNGTLKISSCIIGFILWSILNESYRAQVTLAVPVCFYNIPEKCTINSPEQARVTIAGTRSHVRNLDQQTVALHIDAQKLAEGTNVVTPTSKNLLLPQELSLVKYKPIQLTFNQSDS